MNFDEVVSVGMCMLSAVPFTALTFVVLVVVENNPCDHMLNAVYLLV